MEAVKIASVEEFIGRVKADVDGWEWPWFRGEPRVETPLLPKVYRLREDGQAHDENALLQLFRMKAPVYAADSCPDRGATDQWLFLAQHFGLPTRLLDWTEGALTALYFALLHREGIVWVLDAVHLNSRSLTESTELAGRFRFPLTWFHPEDESVVNIGSINIAGAWEEDGRGVELPVAILPTNIHPRLSVQRSCFTVHGRCKSSLLHQVPNLVLRYEIEPTARTQMRRDLLTLGLSHSSLFPDLGGLAKELGELY